VSGAAAAPRDSDKHRALRATDWLRLSDKRLAAHVAAGTPGPFQVTALQLGRFARLRRADQGVAGGLACGSGRRRSVGRHHGRTRSLYGRERDRPWNDI